MARPSARVEAGLGTGRRVWAVGAAGLTLGVLSGVLTTGVLAADGTLPLVRTVFDAAGVVTVGTAVLPVLLGADGRERDRTPVLAAARRTQVVAAAVWAAAALLLLWSATSTATGTSLLGVRLATVVGYVRAVPSGRAVLVVLVCALVVGALAAAPLERTPLTPVLAALGVVALPVTGHAVDASSRDLAVAAVAVHAVAAAVWVGGVLVVVALAASRRALLAVVLPRFSPLALGCVITVVGTGVLGALLRASPSELLTSGYGRLVIAKTVCVLALVGTGALVRRRVMPALSRHRTGPLTTWALTEVAIMAVAVALAASLAGTPTP